MFRHRNLIWIILLSMFLVVCNREQTEIIVPKSHTVEPIEKTLIERSNQLGFECLRKLSGNNLGGDNLIFSPINSFMSFNILLQASNDLTNREVKQYLHLTHLHDSSIIDGFENLNNLFSGIDNNSIINGKNMLAIKPEIDVNKDFSGKIDNKKYTGILRDENAGFVENIKNNSSVGRNFFQLINTIEFSAQIKYQNRIETSPFYSNPDESNFVKMSVSESEFNCYSDPSIQAVEVPLGRGNFNMLVIIPRGSQTIEGLANNIDDRLLKRIKSKFKMQQLEVYLPLIELSGVETLRNVFLASKLSNCFNKSRADFTRLSSNKPLYLSDFEQISSFKLNPSQLSNSHILSKASKSSFLVDKPFMFVVYEKFSEGVIFIGKITKL